MGRKTLLLVGVVILAGCGGGKTPISTSPSAPSSHDLQVQVVLGYTDSNSFLINAPGCSSGSPHQITVTNQSGTVLGSAEVGLTTPATYDATAVTCTINLDVGQVPDASQYGVSIDGGTPLFYSQAKMQSDSYQIAVHYGY